MDTTTQPESADPRYPDTPIGIVRSRAAFLRDLPALLANPKYDRWLALYCGDERVAFAATHAEIVRQCHGRELKEDEYYLGCVCTQFEGEEDFESFYHEIEEIEDEPCEPTDHHPEQDS